MIDLIVEDMIFLIIIIEMIRNACQGIPVLQGIHICTDPEEDFNQSKHVDPCCFNYYC